MNSETPSHYGGSQPRIFYGWYIVGVGFLSHMVCAFQRRTTPAPPSEWYGGLGMLITLTFGAGGAPFFGFIFDATGSYAISFITFAVGLLICAFLTLLAGAPQKQNLIHAKG
jgi:cyanate permease